MTKKYYQKPTVKVVQLRHQAHILTGTPEPKTLRGTSDDYKELG